MTVRRTLPPALAALAAGCAIALSGCGSASAPASGGATVPPATTAPTTAATTAGTTTAPAPAPATRTASVFFSRDEKVAAAARQVTPPAVARDAMTALLAGPTPAERAAGMTTSIPAGTTLRGLAISGGVARVDLSGAFASGGGSESMLTRVAQVVYTLTGFPTVHSVRFLLDGTAVTAIGGEGVAVDHPLTRADVEDQAPAILIESPAEGATVSPPVRVSGTANTFEGGFELRLLAASGAVLARRSVTASAGTGTRGTFAVTLPATVTAPQAATLRAFEPSAKDGRPIHVVEVHIRLVP